MPARIGIYDWEQYIDQALIFDLCIPININRCKDNKLANTLDYADVCQSITNYVKEHSFFLLETAAEEVFSMLKQNFSLTHMTLTVAKQYAVKNAGSIQVTIDR